MCADVKVESVRRHGVGKSAKPVAAAPGRSPRRCARVFADARRIRFWYNSGMKILVAVLTFLLTVVGQAAPVCVDGVCYPSEEAARADGVSEAKLKAALAEHVDEAGNATQATGMPSTADEVSGKGRGVLVWNGEKHPIAPGATVTVKGAGNRGK